MSSLQLICINYGNYDDAVKVMDHCLNIFPNFDKATILHPKPLGHGPTFYYGASLEIHKCVSPTSNECWLHEMHKYITCDHALSVHWDGFIVNPSSWTDEFLEYDFIGPPWHLTNITNPKWRVGSGGFCMLSNRMAQLLGRLCDPHPEPNDWQFGAIKRASFEKRGIKYAPLELAMKFGEEIPLDDHPRVEKPFGFHGFQYGDHEKYRKMVYG